MKCSITMDKWKYDGSTWQFEEELKTKDLTIKEYDTIAEQVIFFDLEDIDDELEDQKNCKGRIKIIYSLIDDHDTIYFFKKNNYTRKVLVIEYSTRRN